MKRVRIIHNEERYHDLRYGGAKGRCEATSLMLKRDWLKGRVELLQHHHQSRAATEATTTTWQDRENTINKDNYLRPVMMKLFYWVVKVVW